jgi:hypothetical protein
MENKYIGKLMERDVWYGKILGVRQVRTDYGLRHVYKFITRTNKFGVFFSDEKPELEIGVCFTFNGTVKKHSFNEYDKQDETTFNRVEIVKIVGKSEEDSPEVPF